MRSTRIETGRRTSLLLLRDLIHERTGIYYDDEKLDRLAEKLAARLAEMGVESPLDYYYLLKYGEAAEAEWLRLMDVLAVPETYFWRGMDQIKALVEVVVPEHFAVRPHEPLRIWSAGCSSGEEPLTIAIVLKEAGWLDRAPIQIYGTDASPAAIRRARAGLYKPRSLRNVPPDLRERYFVQAEKGWRVLPDLHRRVRWAVVNLMDEGQAAPLASAHVIFCRNVFIYFSSEAIRKVTNLFYRHMPTPGYLFVGASESLLRITDRFRLEEIGGAFAYVKASDPTAGRREPQKAPNC